LIRQLILSFATRGAVAVINFAIFLLLTNQLGAAGYGSVSLLILNIAIIHAVCEVFTGSSLVHFLARSSARQVYLYGLLWIVFAVCFTVLLLSMLTSDASSQALHLLVLGFMAALHAFHGVILLAKTKLRKYQLSVFCLPFFLLSAVSITFYSNTASFQGYIYSFYIAAGLALTLSGILCWPEISGRTNTSHLFSVKPALKNGAMNQLGNLFHILSNRLSYYILGVAATVGLYAGATSLAESVWIISNSISPLVLSRIASGIQKDKNAHITLVMARISFLCSLFVVLVVALVPAWVFSELVGRDFEQVKYLILYLSPGILLISFSSIISHFYSGLGKQRVLLFANACGFAITLVCVWPLIHFFGVKGACLTAVLSYFGQSAVLITLFMREQQFTVRNVFSLRNDLKLLGK